MVGLVTALFIAILLAHVAESRWITPNVPRAFFVALSLLFVYQVFQGGGRQECLFAGLWAGLAGSANYNGIVIATALIGAHVLSRRKDHIWLYVADAVPIVGFLN
ncbi:MAG: glycosyltransferase family 39 protein [Chloroflexi bacterium]|nr:glycosyltransferase family 39 protein [Chloroflexota bacterium]